MWEQRRPVTIGRMKPPLFVRPLTDEERAALRAGLRSPDAFTLRRCQVLLASADGLRPAQIAERYGCTSQSVRNAIRAFAAEGTDCLREKSHRPASVRPELDDAACQRLRALLHRSPRDFGKPSSLWTLATDADAPDPKTLACYGLLRGDTGGMMLRFVEGRPASQVTEDFLAWACERLAAEGKTVLLLIWDNAAWHVSRRDRSWIKAHNRRVKAEGGVRIVACWLPVKAPWLNAIEPKWVHGKRAIIEPERKLTAAEVVERVYGYYGCEPMDPLSHQVA